MALTKVETSTKITYTTPDGTVVIVYKTAVGKPMHLDLTIPWGVTGYDTWPTAIAALEYGQTIVLG